MDTSICNIHLTRECECTGKYDWDIKFPKEQKDLDQYGVKRAIINLDFGEVYVEKARTLHITIENDENNEKHYRVHSNPSAITIYQYFHMKSNSFQLQAFQKKQLKIMYKPLIENTINIDRFLIVDSSNKSTIVYVTGKAVGPHVDTTLDFIKFNTWPEQPKRTTTFELRNFSEYPVQFTFDCSREGSRIFDFSPMTGTIQKKKYILINVTFQGKEYGEHSQRFFCMIHHHSPIIIDCFGIHWRSQNERLGKQFTKYPQNYASNYARYIYEGQPEMDEKPSFAITDTYLNFGNVDIKYEKEVNKVTLFTNFQDHPILVKAFQDEFYNITPKSLEIPGKESVLFECKFKPVISNSIYYRDLLFNVSSVKNETENKIISMPLVLRVLGHTFSENTFWIPTLDVQPEIVIVPPVLPGTVGFVTMELKSFGYLPTSFKFISPTASNFVVKPMIGIVHDLSIVVVALQSAKLPKPKLYAEQWFIVLNNDKNHRVPVSFRGYAEYPGIKVGYNNAITIKGVQVGCKKSVQARIFNTSQHQIFYEFMNYELTDGVTITSEKNSLAPNGTGMMNVTFQSNERICKQLQVTCLVYAMNKLHEIYGSPVEIPVTIYIESDYSNLCSMPDSHDFGVIECHSTQETDFLLFNYGTTTIHYVLTIRKDKSEVSPTNASFSPSSGTIAPKSNASCHIIFTPNLDEFVVLTVHYELRATPDDAEPIPNSWQPIFTFTARVVYPYFQIIEIADHNFYPLFSKRALWRCLDINSVNYALATMKAPGSLVTIDLNLPDAEISQTDFYVTLAVANMTVFPVHVALKRRQICDCKLEEVDRYLSIRKKIYQCPHRKMCELSTMDNTILPNKTHTLRIDLRYTLEGHSTLSYLMTLSNKRQFLLNFKLLVIGLDELWLSKYNLKYELHLHPISLSERQPHVQCFWLYNNTQTSSTYAVDVVQFDTINAAHNFEIFKCLNPNGIVHYMKSMPLLIAFNPIENTLIEFNVGLQVGEHFHKMRIRAAGRKYPARIKIKEKMPVNILKSNISLSVEQLRLDPFPIWSTTTRMIFMTNATQDIIGYNWLTSNINDVCSLEVVSPNGVLRPKQTVKIIIKISSFSHACTLHIDLSCQLISHSTYLQHEMSVKLHAKREKQIQDEFIITEQGMSYQPNDVEILPKPKPFMITITTQLQIISYIDRDTYRTPREQLRHHPKNIIPISDKDFPSMRPIRNVLSRALITRREPSPILEYNDDLYIEDNSKTDLNPKTDNIPLIGRVIEGLLGDAIFSKIFRAAMDTAKTTPTIYYNQIKSHGKMNNLAFRDYMRDLSNEPTVTFMQEVIHKMLLDAIDNIFNLEQERASINYKKEVDLPSTCVCKKKQNMAKLSPQECEGCCIS